MLIIIYYIKKKKNKQTSNKKTNQNKRNPTLKIKSYLYNFYIWPENIEIVSKNSQVLNTFNFERKLRHFRRYNLHSVYIVIQ